MNAEQPNSVHFAAGDGQSVQAQSPQPGALRVWWIPQIPGKPFRVSVASVEQAAFLLNTLAQYDLFQFENNIKPDYSNASGLECFSQDCDGEWCEWYDEETGGDINDRVSA
jgi:hypothetical protein